MFRPSAIALLLVSLLAAATILPPVATAQPVLRCGGMVFLDLDADGDRDLTSQNLSGRDVAEDGVPEVTVRLRDALDQTYTLTTNVTGRWTAPDAAVFPVRVDFTAPDGLQVAPSGRFAGTSTQYLDSETACAAAGHGNLGLFQPGEYCAHNPDLVASCFVVGSLEQHDDMGAIVSLAFDTVDNGSTTANDAADWMDPLYRPLATVGQVGSVFGTAVGPDGAVYASAFVKRHTRLTSSLNPDGNPTAIYRVVDGSVELLVTVDPSAKDPHAGIDAPGDYAVDAAAFGAVYTDGLGDIQLGIDGATLYAVDLGRRQLVTVDIKGQKVTDRVDMTRASLGVDDCAHSVDGSTVDGDSAGSAADPFGDLRPFGLGLDHDGDVLVGVVCSAASTVVSLDLPVDRVSSGGGAGDHDRLHGYVFGYDGDSFTQRLSWPLAGDRGQMQAGGELAQSASWHPWVDSYPFDREYDHVAYPQPAITDIVVGPDRELVIALGDRWGHQTGPRTEVPSWDGVDRTVAEPLSAGDIVRACETDSGWIIEGADECPGGAGEGEHFSDDHYGLHEETALGSLVAVPGYDGVVAAHMDPIPADDTWQSGGLIWHDVATGRATKGVRLYDGRNADPDTTFEKASGIGGLAVNCGRAPIQLGGSVWYDVDANGVRDPAESGIADAEVSLLSDSGDVLGTLRTDDDGMYLFDNRSNAPGLVRGDGYRIVLGADNYVPGAVFGPGGEHVGRTLSDASGEPGQDNVARLASNSSSDAHGFHAPTIEGVAGDDSSTTIEESHVRHGLGFAMTDQYDLALLSVIDEIDLGGRTASFAVVVRNQGSVPSGPFSVTDQLPDGTTFVDASHDGTHRATPTGTTVEWNLEGSDELDPGEELTLIVSAALDTLQHEAINIAEISEDAGHDDDSTPDAVLTGPNADLAIEHRSLAGLQFDAQHDGLDEDDHDIATIGIAEVGGKVWIDQRQSTGERTDGAPGAEGVGGVELLLFDDQGDVVASTTTKEDGRYAFSELKLGQYEIAIADRSKAKGRALEGLAARGGTAISERFVVDLDGDSPINEGIESPSHTLDAASDLTLNIAFHRPVEGQNSRAPLYLLGVAGLLLAVGVKRLEDH